MEDTKAKELLGAERLRVERLLKDIDEAGAADRVAADQEGDMFDSAEPLTTEGTDDAVRAGLEDRLAIDRRARSALGGRHLWLLGAQRATNTGRSPRGRSDRRVDDGGGSLKEVTPRLVQICGPERQSS